MPVPRNHIRSRWSLEPATFRFLDQGLASWPSDYSIGGGEAVNERAVLGGGGQRKGSIGGGRRSTKGQYWGEAVNERAVLGGGEAVNERAVLGGLYN